jgi:hypothetical protein
MSRPRRLESAFPIGTGFHCIILHLENRGDVAPHIGVILDEQNSFPAGSGFS